MGAHDGWTIDDVPDQTGKRFVITGANSGIGYEAARVLALRGGHVVLACRNPVRAEAAAADIRAAAPDSPVDTVALDLASLSSIRAAARELTELGDPIDVLVNNAGIMMVPEGTTADGFELQLGTNHLGHFAFTGLVLDLVLASPSPRVVTVSSLAHRSGKMNFADLQSKRKYSRFGAYAQSKLANLLFTMELQRRFRRGGYPEALSLAAHPGVAESNLGSGISGGGWERAQDLLSKLGPYYLQSAADGALPILRAACDRDVKGGDFFGPARFRQSRGPAVKVKAKPKVYDVHDARGLWEASVELTGVSYDQLQ